MRLAPVITEQGRRLWRAMLRPRHPEGEAKAPGQRLTYLIETATAAGVGGLSFVAAPMRLEARDQLSGWSPRAHGSNLERVLSNHRFLLLRDMRVPNLASHALARAAEQVRRDCKLRHGVELLLLETCVHLRHAGASYLAAG